MPITVCVSRRAESRGRERSFHWLPPMNQIAQSLARFVLRRVLLRACEATVPRSGEDGEKVNCFITKVHQGDVPLPVVLALDGNNLIGLAWDGKHYGLDICIPLEQIKLSQFRVTHFYGLWKVQYSGLLDFLVGRVTTWPYVKIHAVRFISRIDQYFFNKKKLITKRRMELLSFLVNRHLDGKTEFAPIDLMTDLYTLRWVEHPDRDAAMQQLELYLQAMVETGELEKIDYKYRVSGHALLTIEENEEQERKHTENVRMQRGMLWLTVVIAALTAVQAQLIKLPTIFDFSK